MKRILALSTAAALALAPVAALAQTQISKLPAGSAVAASDVVPVSQSCTGSPPTATCGATNGVQASALKTFMSASPTLVTPQLGVAKATSLAGSAAITSITAGGTSQIGTGGTAVCATSHVCDNLSGEITLTTGTGTLATGTLFTLNFSVTRTNIPNCVDHLQSAAASTNNFLTQAPTTSTLAIAASTALAASTTYTFDYVCGGG